MRLQDVYMFVKPRARRSYVRAGFACNVIEGEPGLAPQRNYIEDFFVSRFGRGHHVVSFDDDVVGLERASVRDMPPHPRGFSSRP